MAWRSRNAEIITFKIYKDLRFVLQPPEGSGVQHSVSVALESGAIIGFGIQGCAALAILAAHTIWCKAVIFDFFEFLA
ncbi:MAG: hypothetical protein NTV38_09345 [Chloroflexi bacterium]|nr:hypothetical protein [Chloroflexota bacterium]